MKYYAILLSVLLLAMATHARATEQLDLKSAVDQALKHNHLVQAASLESRAADAGMKASRARFLPRLMFEERAATTNSATRAFMMELDQGRFSLAGDLNNPARTSDFQTSVTLEQPLLDAGLMYGTDVADQESSARKYALEKRRQDTAYQVYGAYLQVQRNKALRSVAEQAVTDAREHLRLAQVRNRAGTGLKFDELRLDTYLAELEQQKITADHDVTLARLRLGQTIGMPPGAAPDIAALITAEALTATPENIEQEALLNRADLKESAAEVARGDAAVKAVGGSFWPTLYATGSFQMNDSSTPFGRDNDSWLVAAVLRWDAFDPVRRKGDLERSQALRDAGVQYQHALRQEIALQVREALLRRTEAEQRLDVSRRSAAASEEMVRLVSRRFESGLATAVELLDAQTALNRVRSQIADNEAACALATGRVYHAAGLFLKEVVR